MSLSLKQKSDLIKWIHHSQREFSWVVHMSTSFFQPTLFFHKHFQTSLYFSEKTPILKHTFKLSAGFSSVKKTVPDIVE